MIQGSPKILRSHAEREFASFMRACSWGVHANCVRLLLELGSQSSCVYMDILALNKVSVANNNGLIHAGQKYGLGPRDNDLDTKQG